ncbi:MAG: hypothetical protein AB1394_07525 [Bacteroidota bacterium]
MIISYVDFLIKLRCLDLSKPEHDAIVKILDESALCEKASVPAETLVRQGVSQPVQKGGRFEIEKHTEADKSFCIKVPNDFDIYLQIDYDDVYHEKVDKEAAAIVALLNTYIEEMRALCLPTKA